MKTPISLIALMLFLHPVGYGQKLQWSLPQKVSERSYITECIGENSSGLYIMKRNNRGQSHNIILERYSDDMRRSVDKMLLTKHGEYFIKFFMDSTGVSMLYAVPDKDKKLTQIMLKKIGPSLNDIGKDTAIFSVEGNDPEQAMITGYRMKTDPDILVTYTSEKNDNPSSYNYILFDNEFKKLFSGILSIGSANKSSIEQVCFTRDEIALLVHEELKNKGAGRGYRFSIYDNRFGETELNKTELFSDSFSVTEGILKPDFKNNTLVFGGLFANKDSTYVKGYYFWQKDLKTNKSSYNYTRFSRDIIAEMAGRSNHLAGIFNLRAGDLALRGDGGMILSAEEYQETHETVTDINAYGVAQPNVRNFFYYQNLLVLSINPKGGVDWHTVLRKDQVTVNDNGTFSSYLLTVTPDRLLYVFNDLSRKNWNLSVTEINDKGEATTGILVRPQNYEGRMIPQYGDQVAYNEFLIPGITPRGIVLLKVTY